MLEHVGELVDRDPVDSIPVGSPPELPSGGPGDPTQALEGEEGRGAGPAGRRGRLEPRGFLTGPTKGQPKPHMHSKASGWGPVPRASLQERLSSLLQPALSQLWATRVGCHAQLCVDRDGLFLRDDHRVEV